MMMSLISSISYVGSDEERESLISYLISIAGDDDDGDGDDDIGDNGDEDDDDDDKC